MEHVYERAWRSLVVKRRIAHEINEGLLALGHEAVPDNFQMIDNMAMVVPERDRE
jgi:hypothetical protein